jgi:hypothetical protein
LEKRENANSLLIAMAILKCNQSLLSPIFFFQCTITKKGKDVVLFALVFYGRFLMSNRASIIPTITIATIMPATAGTKYMSAADCCGASVGAVVGATSSTTKAVSACEGQ